MTWKIETTPCKVLSHLFPSSPPNDAVSQICARRPAAAAASSSSSPLFHSSDCSVSDGVAKFAPARKPWQFDKQSPNRSRTITHKLLENPKVSYAFALLLIDALLVPLIIAYVPYTKIDWDAYMSQIQFGILYILNFGIVLFIYVKTDVLPWWALSLLCLSKRVHSIFVLRLFNDCFAMTLLHAALCSFFYRKWHLGLVIFSGAVSVKMNVLLYSPTLRLLMFKAMDIAGVFSALVGAALVQVSWTAPAIRT